MSDPRCSRFEPEATKDELPPPCVNCGLLREEHETTPPSGETTPPSGETTTEDAATTGSTIGTVYDLAYTTRAKNAPTLESVADALAGVERRAAARVGGLSERVNLLRGTVISLAGARAVEPASPPRVHVETGPVAALGPNSYPNLAHALGVARDQVRTVQKRGRAKFETSRGGSVDYTYASADDVVFAARAALENSGVVILPKRLRIDWSKSAGGNNPMLLRTFVVAHSSGESIECKWEWPVVIGSGGRTIEKAVAAAATGSFSYFLRDLLELDREEEDDANFDPRASAKKRDDAGESEGDRATREAVARIDRVDTRAALNGFARVLADLRARVDAGQPSHYSDRHLETIEAALIEAEARVQETETRKGTGPILPARGTLASAPGEDAAESRGSKGNGGRGSSAAPSGSLPGLG